MREREREREKGKQRENSTFVGVPTGCQIFFKRVDSIPFRQYTRIHLRQRSRGVTKVAGMFSSGVSVVCVQCVLNVCLMCSVVCVKCVLNVC